MVQKWTAAVHTVRNLGVHLCTAEHGGRVRADLWHTLGIGPNPGRIDWVHLLDTWNTDPRSVVVQRVGQQKREGVVGGPISAGIENPT